MSTSKTTKTPAAGAAKKVAAPVVETVAVVEPVQVPEPEPVAVQVESVAVEPEIVPEVAPIVAPEPEAAKPVKAAAVKKTAATVAAFVDYEQIVAFGKDNVEALVKSNTIVAKGVQDLSRSFASFAQLSFEETVQAGKALIGAKSFKEVVDLTTTFAKGHLDKIVTEGSKFGQASAKLAEEALAPLSHRVEVAVEKLIKPAA